MHVTNIDMSYLHYLYQSRFFIRETESLGAISRKDYILDI